MRRRAEQVDETRQRIVAATVRLHGTLGPRATTITGIAEEAGVTRLTVYRHFPDEEALFGACSAHWAAQRTLPDHDAWTQVPDPEERLRVGLTDLYRFYRDGEAMLTRIHRDASVLPAPFRERLAADERAHRDLLLAPFRRRGARRQRLAAVLGHAVAFWTWRSLCVDNGLADGDAVDAMVRLATATARGA